MKILVTGVAGFIGMHACIELLRKNNQVIGIDNFNDYYDPSLKKDRIKNIKDTKDFIFINCDITNEKKISEIFLNNQIDLVLHLAAQAGVRYSFKNPHTYIENNIKGFLNILECCRKYKIKRLVYASSSSVYGSSSDLPFNEIDNCNQPLNLYAVTKKSNELMAHAYSSLYDMRCIGIRFFTAYGPWGRPDMALSIFASSIMKDKPINVYNKGNMIRDFTYIDDIISGTIKIIEEIDNIISRDQNKVSHNVFNLGNGNSATLLDYIKCLEVSLKKKAILNLLPMQKGEMIETKANISKIRNYIDYSSTTGIDKGVEKFTSWYLNYHKKEI